MTDYALVENGFVVQVCVVDGSESEALAWLGENVGGEWKPAERLRGVKAGIGFGYDSDLDVFVQPQPFPSWSFNEESCVWEAPKPYPADGSKYFWDESANAWLEVANEVG